ncbi:hepatoma-derived growth factor-related protein 2 [Iris pallida]|uniref:Hepatoma-derived growth factor-related protein 2 n=1 Tax=Iris pallida TaxID=29817 RepID=A0AAX6F3F9_IRIPA|nr:hepatoma-derived growth factor-related protein 2 [Iris pallida]
MQSHYRQGSHRRDVGDYEYEDYDEYEDEEEGSEEEEEEEEEEDPVKSKEQQEFLSLREKLKERIRQKLKKQTASTSGRQPQVSKRTSMTNDKFGSFFGPSQSVIASRVLDERRSIQETSLVVSRAPSSSSASTKGSSSTPSEKKAHVQHQKARVVNEVKKKAQALKDMRDYSFLLSDDADLPAPEKEQPRPPAVRKPAPVSDGHSAQASSKVKPPMGKPSRPVPNGHESKNSVARNLLSQTRVGPAKGAVVSRPRPASAEHRKVGAGSGSNGSGRPIGHKPLPSKSSAVATGTSRPPAKVANEPRLKTRVPSAVPHPSIQKNHQSSQRRPSERPEKVRTAPKQPLPSSKSQMEPSKKIPMRDSRKDKKMPVKRKFDEDDGGDAIAMIRNMFRYDPNKFVGVDEDVSDMEADFSQIQKEENYSAKIGRKEDEEEFLRIQEDERLERMRKKQKLSRR